MNARLLRGAILVACAMLVACALSAGALFACAHAAGTREFRLDDLAGALAGDRKEAGIAATGALMAVPPHEAVLTGEASFVWALEPDGEGSVYAATGSQGKVYRISGSGQSKMVAETLEFELFAMAPFETGFVLAGAPNGTVMRLGRDGKLATIVDLPEGSVWSLIADRRGSILAASGEEGEIYRVASDGAATRFAKVPDAHVVSFAWWGDRLICGTDGRGLLLEIDPASGKERVLYDAAEEEIVALLPCGDRLLFAANGAGSPTGEPEVSGDLLVLPTFEVRPDGSASGGGLYEIDARGFVRRVWQAPEKRILSLAIAPDGRVLAGTGEQGILFALDSMWNETRIADFAESDLLSLLSLGRRVYVGTGNGGSVHLLDWDATRRGEYWSKVLDATQPSTWGSPSWTALGDGSVGFETRSGQTSSPDESWSDWQRLAGGRIASPPARYLQWRANLTSGAAQDFGISGVAIPYRGPNRAPEILALAVTARPGEIAGGGASAPVRQELPGGVKVEYELPSDEAAAPADAPARPGIWARTLRSAVWKASDPDGDDLRYDVFLRALDEEDFQLLKRDLENAAWTWESAAWPDGSYEVKVVARDEGANAAGEALSATRLSAPFTIDNTPPVLEALSVTTTADGWRIKGRARDAGSRVSAIEISVNGRGWRPVVPSDGIVDGTVEEFDVPVAREADGPAVAGVRVTDGSGHLATGRVRLAAQGASE